MRLGGKPLSFLAALQKISEKSPRGYLGNVARRALEAEDMYFSNFRFEQTSHACPEQYDVFHELDGKTELVGYVRLRHGHLSVKVPNVGGEMILSVHGIEGDGMFSSGDERTRWMDVIGRAIAAWQFSKGCVAFKTNFWFAHLRNDVYILMCGDPGDAPWVV